jgi:transcriptional regulator with XRE-family HTH domain
MPKSADVEDFAAKLALLTKRLNWSRAKLAQQVGVDKSLTARWLNGNSRPTGNSLMQLTTAVAHAIENFTAADWDLAPEQFARRLGIEPLAAPGSPGPQAATRLTLSGLRNPPPATVWGPAYAGAWAGFYQSLTNRGVVRLCAAEFAVQDDGLRLAFTEGFFLVEGQAIATHTHVQAICEISTLDNHLMFFTFNSAQDVQGAAVIDGLISVFGADHAPTAGPILLFRVGDEAERGTVPLEELMPRVVKANEEIEREAARTGNAFAGMREIVSSDILQSLCLAVGTPRADGQTDHLMRIPPKRSLAIGKLAMSNLPASAPLRIVPANLRRVLGLDAADKIRLVHSKD